jgi:hypothetical protein
MQQNNDRTITLLGPSQAKSAWLTKDYRNFAAIHAAPFCSNPAAILGGWQPDTF